VRTEPPAVRLFVGGHAGTVQGEREDLAGDRMFTAAHPPQAARFRAASEIDGVLDSGAFTDPPHKRLTPEQALDRQLAWEPWASRIWQSEPWQARGLVSYDRLIDETWVAGEKHKRRWSVTDAEAAVAETIAAARYLASQRSRVEPRTLILSCQGVDAHQYDECAAEVIAVVQPQDWIGLGGWCILGRQQRWLPTFWQTIRLVLPRIARAGVRNVHIFGVLWQTALGGLVWLADRYGLTVSTDSTAPVLACTWKNWKKAGARHQYWRDNVQWWIDTLSDLRSSPLYKEPPQLEAARQEIFL
jgi:hypothetical protein